MIYTKSVYIACIYTLYIQKIKFSYTGVYIHIYKLFENFIYSVYIHYIYKKCIYHIYRFENHYCFEGILTEKYWNMSYATLKVVYILYIYKISKSHIHCIYTYIQAIFKFHIQYMYILYIQLYIYSKIYIYTFLYI